MVILSLRFNNKSFAVSIIPTCYLQKTKKLQLFNSLQIHSIPCQLTSSKIHLSVIFFYTFPFFSYTLARQPPFYATGSSPTGYDCGEPHFYPTAPPLIPSACGTFFPFYLPSYRLSVPFLPSPVGFPDANLDCRAGFRHFEVHFL